MTGVPCNYQAEQSVLGAILIEPKVLSTVRAILPSGSDFYEPTHALIYDVLCVLQDRKQSIDVLTVSESLSKLRREDDEHSTAYQLLHGGVYLPQLMEQCIGAANVEYHAQIVREKADCRFLIPLSQEIHTLAMQGNMEALRAANGRYNLSAIIANMSPATESSRYLCLADVEREIVKWLWRGWIPFGKISMVIGDPGLGKGNMTLDIAARLTRGSPMPFQETAFHAPSDVLMMFAEDGAGDTVRPRMEAAGADLRRVHLYNPETPDSLEMLSNLERLETDIRRDNVKLVIVDPLMAFFPAALDSHKDQHARRVLSPVSALAQRTGAAFVFVHHPNKAAGGQAVYRAGGSIGIIGAARAACIVAVDPDDSEKRVLATIKNNLSKPSQSLRFHMEAATDVEPNAEDAPPRIVWDNVADEHTASSLLFAPSVPQETSGAKQEAADFLQDALKDGPVKSAEIERAAREASISHRTLLRAKKESGVVSKRIGGAGSKGYWELSLSSQENKSTDEDMSEDS